MPVVGCFPDPMATSARPRATEADLLPTRKDDRKYEPVDGELQGALGEGVMGSSLSN
jgi:hypothetical protein